MLHLMAMSPTLRRTFEKCLRPLSSRVGAGFCSVIKRTFIGGNLANGACPWHISRSVMPKDQMSAEKSYLQQVKALRYKPAPEERPLYFT